MIDRSQTGLDGQLVPSDTAFGFLGGISAYKYCFAVWSRRDAFWWVFIRELQYLSAIKLQYESADAGASCDGEQMYRVIINKHQAVANWSAFQRTAPASSQVGLESYFYFEINARNAATETGIFSICPDLLMDDQRFGNFSPLIPFLSTDAIKPQYFISTALPATSHSNLLAFNKAISGEMFFGLISRYQHTSNSQSTTRIKRQIRPSPQPNHEFGALFRKQPNRWKIKSQK